MVKRILLQHWADDQPPEINRLSARNIAAYADRIGADYRFLSGFPFDKRLASYCQKLYMLDPEFDGYETVCMVDCDMFALMHAPSIFDEQGYGWRHAQAHARVMRHHPSMTSAGAPYWGGAIYRLPLNLRKRLRAEYDYSEAAIFNDMDRGYDEGIMHRLAMRAGINAAGAYFSKRWCHGSYELGVEDAAIVHVRQRRADRTSAPKIDNYRELAARGVIA